jgi:hypothetical protein
VTVIPGQDLVVGVPRHLAPPPRGLVASGFLSDFSRFLLALDGGDGRRASLTLVTHWTSLLKR